MFTCPSRRQPPASRRRSPLVLAIALLVSLPSAAASAQDTAGPGLDSPPVQVVGLSELERRLQLERERAAAAMADADASRSSLMERALELSRYEKVEAKTEREQLLREKARLQHLNEVRQWALGSFEPSRRERLPEVAEIPRLHQRWEASRERWTRHFLTASEQTKGAIVSGRALNLFLDACGRVAVDHELLQQKVAAESQQIQIARTDLQNRLDAAAPERRAALLAELDQLDQQAETVKLKQQLLSCVGGHSFMTPHQRRNLRFQRGILGPKLVVTGANEALPLNWPPLLVADPAYDPLREALSQVRETALQELRDGNGISVETERAMLYAVQAIHDQFQQYRRDYFTVNRDEQDAHHNQRYLQARQFVDGLRSQVVRFVEARHIADLELEQEFQGETIEELLAYMTRNGLTFPTPTDLVSQDTYQVIYKEMVAYYLSLHSLELAAQATERDLDRAQEDIERLMDIQYRDTLESLGQALKAGNEHRLVLELENGGGNPLAALLTSLASGFAEGVGKDLGEGASRGLRKAVKDLLEARSK